MPEVSSLLFGAAVFLLVGIMILAPRIARARRRPTTHEMYFGDIQPIEPWARPSSPSDGIPAGAPRAPSPLVGPTGAAERQPNPQESSPSGMRR